VFDERPAILFVDDNRSSFETLVANLPGLAEGRLAHDFEFIYLANYGQLRAWYERNRHRFVSLIIQDLDFRDLPEKEQIMPVPDRWQPPPSDFDAVGLQGIIIYDLLRNEKIDTIVPVLFVSSHIGLHRSREFAEYIVHPGFGACAFVPEDAVGERYYPEVARSITELALRPLTRAQRDQWRDDFAVVLGASRRMACLAYEVERIAPSDSIVLILGEPGVGKELVARALHQKSPRYDPNDARRRQPLTVNIAALEKNLVEDELFGHLRGAFTDASSERTGIFEAAQGSTVFLDEIGDLSREVQLKLLRVIEYRQIKKLGSSQEIPIDNRIIAATNRTSQEIIRNFRPDFVGRLVQHCILVPGLRERWEGHAPRIIEDDVHELINYFLAGMNRKLPAGNEMKITDVAVRFLSQSVQEYIAGSSQLFANNIRTLRNVVERAFERAQAQRKSEVTLGEIIATLGMIKLVSRQPQAIQPQAPTVESVVGSLELVKVERRIIEEAMRKTTSLLELSRITGMHRDTLRYKIREYGLAD
jgi:transcriptional regulator with GAF, ATPase, and Fis domain